MTQPDTGGSDVQQLQVLLISLITPQNVKLSVKQHWIILVKSLLEDFTLKYG